MKYSESCIGRVFTVKFDDGEDLIKGIDKFLGETGVMSGMIFLLGALRKAEIVTGPIIDEIPPTPKYKTFDKVHEIVALGTIFPSNGKPAIHIHGSFGRGEEAITGCLRNTATVFLITEAIILELNTVAERIFDVRSKHFLLDPSPDK